jgi:hypothetical protein
LIRVLAVVSLCTPPQDGPPPEPSVRIAVDREEVEFGGPFALTLVRTWPVGSVPDALPADAFAPLAVRLLESSRRTDRTVEETRRYEARAFALDTVTVPVPTLRARAGGTDTWHLAMAPPFTLRVRPSLGAEAGPPELPLAPFPPPPPDRTWLVGGGLAAVAAIAVWLRYRWRRRRRSPAAAPPPHERALAWLARLARAAPGDRDGVRNDAAETTAMLRGYLAERFDLSAPAATPERLIARARHPDLTEPGRAALAGLFDRLDKVKFTAVVPPDEQRRQLLAEIERFVAESAAP